MFKTAIWTSKNARGAEARRIVSFGTNIRDTGRNGLFFQNCSFGGFLRMQDRWEERSLLSERQFQNDGRNDLFFQNGSFSGFLRMQDRREERREGTTGRNSLFFRNGSFSGFLRMQNRREERIEEPSPGLEFVKGNWHSGFFFNNCSAFLY
ncbi:hypothetical protein GLOIN_2v1761170 [Rhizophagus irregularis DAOM 181602=DAOM 197198]|nr:hypothetical protein GLOIN_2v1761170 [Rhizophagus irregularis DAOM 181602=DAOM 197198]